MKASRILLSTALLLAAGTAMADGKQIYDTRCVACHNTSSTIPNVPKLGDKAAWAPRIASGVDAMLTIVKTGKGAMPPKGTCPTCSDDELKSAIEYMVSQSQ